MNLVQNISGRVQSAPKDLAGITMVQESNNWGIGQSDYVPDEVMSFYRGHTVFFL